MEKYLASDSTEISSNPAVLNFAYNLKSPGKISAMLRLGLTPPPPEAALGLIGPGWEKLSRAF